MDYVHKQIEDHKEELRVLEKEMYRTQQRYHMFEADARKLYEAGEKHRNHVFRPFAELAGEDVWHSLMEVLDQKVDAHTYDRCRKIIEMTSDSRKHAVKLITAFCRACPHVMAHKLQGDLCLKSHECLLVNRRLNRLYTDASRALDSYGASTADRISSTQPACAL